MWIPAADTPVIQIAFSKVQKYAELMRMAIR